MQLLTNSYIKKLLILKGSRDLSDKKLWNKFSGGSRRGSVRLTKTPLWDFMYQVVKSNTLISDSGSP